MNTDNNNNNNGDGKTVLVEVSVSDDSARVTMGAVPVTIGSVQQAIHRAWAEAPAKQRTKTAGCTLRKGGYPNSGTGGHEARRGGVKK